MVASDDWVRETSKQQVVPTKSGPGRTTGAPEIMGVQGSLMWGVKGSLRKHKQLREHTAHHRLQRMGLPSHKMVSVHVDPCVHC